jgi:hypothetical protein
LLILTTACASILALAHWLDDYGGLGIAIPITVLPLCFLIEYLFAGSVMDPKNWTSG